MSTLGTEDIVTDKDDPVEQLNEALKAGGGSVDEAPGSSSPESKKSTARRRSSRPTGSSRRTSTAPRTSSAKFEQELTDFFRGLGIIAELFDPFDGQHIQKHADKLGQAWSRLADKDPRVKRALVSLMTGGAYGEAMMTTTVIALPILKHHGLIGRRSVTEGDTPDDVLAANDEELLDMVQDDAIDILSDAR